MFGKRVGAGCNSKPRAKLHSVISQQGCNGKARAVRTRREVTAMERDTSHGRSTVAIRLYSQMVCFTLLAVREPVAPSCPTCSGRKSERDVMDNCPKHQCNSTLVSRLSHSL